MNFRKIKGSFLSTDGVTKIACYFYEPQVEPIGVLQISHGMCEYLERYEEFADFLCSKGFIVCGNDHLGHGATANNSENLGFFAEKGGADYLPEDVFQLTRIAKKRYPGQPYFLLGHSMGSFIARQYLALHGGELDGAILCGTAGPNPALGAGQKMASLLVSTGHGKHRSSFLNRLAFGSYNHRFDAPKSQYAWLSREESIVRKYEQDPLCSFVFTASGFRDLFTLLGKVSAKDWAGKVPKDLPIFLIAGEDDPVGNYGKGVRQVERMLRNAGIRDLSCRLYPGGRHEILNETNRQEVYEDVWKWLQTHVDSVNKM